MKRLSQPPRYAQRLLLMFLRDDLHEEVVGDLDEKFKAMTLSGKPFRARLNYWYQVFNYLRPFAMRKSPPSIFYHGMLFNYSKIALRNLSKQKLYACLNIGGLAVGIAAFIMIALFVQYEFSYDRFLSGNCNVYRVYQKQAGNLYMGSEYFAVTPIQLAGVLRDEFAEVEYATTLHSSQSLLQQGDNSFLEYGITVDEHFFEVFPFELKAGTYTQALTDINSIVLTEKLATKIFGDESALGKIIGFDNKSTRMVTAIVKDPPLNSTLQFDYLVNIRGNEFHAAELAKAKWNNNS
jgi:putative ABC transport system permease protein